MATTVEQVDALGLVRSEDEHLEFKAAENRYDFEELIDYCVALANEGGGRIILGMTDKMPRRVVGTKAFDVPERTVAGIHKRLQLKVMFDEVAHPGGRVLVFHVPSRPKGQPVHYKGKYLMRAGEELVPMSPDQLRAIFAEGQPDWLSQAALTDCAENPAAYAPGSPNPHSRISKNCACKHFPEIEGDPGAMKRRNGKVSLS